MARRRRSTLCTIGEILAIVSGILGILLTILTLMGTWTNESWFFNPGFGFEHLAWSIIGIVFSILVLLIGLGSIFTKISLVVLGILVIVFAIFIPGLACILGIVSGIVFLIDGLA